MKPSFFTTYVFQNTRLAWFWFLVRVYLGWEWLSAGYEKIINPVWVGSNAGGALTGFIKGALLKTSGLHPDVQGWYASFLSHMVLPHAYVWSHFVAVGEVLVGLGLIVGCLTTTAAFFGFFMNLNYLLSGTVSVNPILLILSLGIMLSRGVAARYGFDYYVMPKVKKSLAIRGD